MPKPHQCFADGRSADAELRHDRRLIQRLARPERPIDDPLGQPFHDPIYQRRPA
jgi:hypothetical protein